MSKLFSEEVDVKVDEDVLGKLTAKDKAIEDVKEEFKEKAKEEIKKEKKSRKVKEEVKIENKVKVDINNLNIRKGPGIGFGKDGFCKPGIYEILKEENGYGQIGADQWIALKFAKKL